MEFLILLPQSPDYLGLEACSPSLCLQEMSGMSLC